MNKHPSTFITPEGVYAEFERPVARLCRRMIRNPSDAEDAAQEVWIEILRSLPRFEGRSKTSTWVWTIARWAILQHAQKEKAYSARFPAGECVLYNPVGPQAPRPRRKVRTNGARTDKSGEQ